MKNTINNTTIKEIEKDIFLFLDHIYTKPKKSIISISGGADSMCMATIIYHYREKKGWNPKKLYFVYCDHKTRKHNDPKTIQSYITPEPLHIIERKNTKKNTEESLRNRRYEVLNDFGKKNKASILITGHNLSDRIESTFLNLLRGCYMDGFMSMKPTQTRNKLFDGIIIRPLLHIPKRYITHLCNTYDIPYNNDPTNKDKAVSKRNLLRHDIIDPLIELSHKTTNKSSSFEESFKHIYQTYNQDEHYIPSHLEKIPMCHHWNSQWAYKWTSDPKKITTKKLKDICNYLRISNNISKKNLEEISNFIAHKKSGHKYINQTYFFINHGVLYIISGPKKFRENTIKTPPEDMNDLFTDQKEKGKKTSWRLPRSEDKIHGKNFNKRCINQKIPLFRRKAIPIYKENNVIVPYVYGFMYSKK